eukprot:COSAG01_NODE_20946_length_926_cov_1.484885_1_plen_206_part_01
MRLRRAAAAPAVLLSTAARPARGATAFAAFSYLPLRRATAVFAAANGLGLAVSAAAPGCHLHLDLLGAGAFALAAWATPAASTRSRLSAALVGAWGTRLAGFLFYRVLSSEDRHDARLDNVGMGSFWAVSFLWGVVCSLPHTLGAGAVAATGVLARHGRSARAGLGWGAAAWAALAAAGLAVESLADVQKLHFKRDAANAGRFCDV